MTHCKFCDRPAVDTCGHCQAPTCSEHSYICLDDGLMICPDCNRLDAEIEDGINDLFGDEPEDTFNDLPPLFYWLEQGHIK